MGEWSSRVLSILRIIAALLFMEHGLMKLFHFPGPQPGVPDPIPALRYAAAVIELLGGALLVAGLFSKIIALVCSGEMAVGYFMAHASKRFWPALNGVGTAIHFISFST